MFNTFHRSITALCKKGHAHLAENYKKLKPDLFLNLQCGHGLRSVFTSGVVSLRTLLVSAGQNFRPWCSHRREKVVGDDNDLSNLRESCGDVLKLQRRAEFAGNRCIRVNLSDATSRNPGGSDCTSHH